MKISYYLNEGRKKNLYCRITDGPERATFSLEHIVDPKEWNIKKEEIEFPNVHHFTLMSLKTHLEQLYHQYKTENKHNIVQMLKVEAETLMNGQGLKGVDRSLFDRMNREYGIPQYDDFIKAFEKYTKLASDQYQVQTLGSLIHVHTKDEVYEIDTYPGLQERLKSYIDRRSYDEIYVGTKEQIWSEIYKDAGIEKHNFMPVLWGEWELFWRDKYSEIKKEIGKTDHLDEMKAKSWRAVQVFMECYNDSDDAIMLGYEIDETDLYPLTVITMLKIFDAETSYEEYCELEFENAASDDEEWEHIDLSNDDDDWESPTFFIRPYMM